MIFLFSSFPFVLLNYLTPSSPIKPNQTKHTLDFTGIVVCPQVQYYIFEFLGLKKEKGDKKKKRERKIVQAETRQDLDLPTCKSRRLPALLIG